MDINYHTLKGYEILEDKKITYAMEDYLEMIFRSCEIKGFVRISELSKMLNVKPSSVSKMVNNLKAYGLIQYEKYGYIVLTKSGTLLGQYLLHRHNIINDFLCALNGTHDELEQTEKIEHYIDDRTVRNMETATKCIYQYHFPKNST